MKRLRSFVRVLPLAAYGVLFARPAAAADGWEQPFIDIIDSLTSGLGLLGTGLLGIGIMALGAWAAFTGRMEWNRFIYVILGAALVMGGPTAAKGLMGG